MNGCQPFNEICFHTCGSSGGYSIHPIVLQVPVVAGCRISETGIAWAKGRRLNTLFLRVRIETSSPVISFFSPSLSRGCLSPCLLVWVLWMFQLVIYFFFLSVCATTLCDLCPSSDNLTASLFECSDAGRLTEARTFFWTYI